MNDRPLPAEDRALRQRAVDAARTDIELSGYAPTPEAEELDARYVAGDLSWDDHLAAMLDHARSLPAGEPVQTYFASLEELERAVAIDRNGKPHDGSTRPR